MSNDLRIRLAFVDPVFVLQLVTQRLIVLYNAVVHQCHFAGGMRVRIGCCRCAMRGPACVRNANRPRQWTSFQHLDQIGELAFRTPPVELSTIDCAKPGAVIAPVLHPAQTIDQPFGHWFFAYDPDDAAHRLPRLTIEFWIGWRR